MAESKRQKVKDLVERLNNDNNNYYQKLGIKPGASRQEIKEAKAKIQDLLRGYQFDDNYNDDDYDYDDEWNEYESRDFMDDYNRSYGIVDDIVNELTTPSTKEDYDKKIEDEKSSSILNAITIDLIQIYKSIEKGLLSINNSINIVSNCTDWLTKSIVGLLKSKNKSALSGENLSIPSSPQQESIQSASFMSQIPQETPYVRSDDLSGYVRDPGNSNRGYESSAQGEVNALNQIYNIIEQVNETQLTLQEQKEQQPQINSAINMTPLVEGTTTTPLLAITMVSIDDSKTPKQSDTNNIVRTDDSKNTENNDELYNPPLSPVN